MGVEQRGNSAYYYQKHWRNGTCVSQYVGNGPVAELIALSETLRKTEERQKRAAVKREQQSIKEQAALVLARESDVRQLVKAVLLACGYHQHKRQWRKDMQDQSAPLAPVAEPVTQDMDQGWQALRAALNIEAVPVNGKVTKAAEAQAEQERRTAVRQVLRDYPVIWSRTRKLLSSAERTLIEKVTPTEGSNGRALLEHAVKGIRRDLGYQDAPMLEQLLIEQVAVAWLDLSIVHGQYAENAVQGHTLTVGAYWDRRVSGAQARYLRAMEALARVRRLAMPQPLQVNIGGQQINVAGG